MNYQRLALKINNSNWGRPASEIEDIFLKRVNQIRCQSNMLMFSSILVKEDDVMLVELFSRLHTRMHEIAFENAGLLKRIHM